MEIKRLAHSKKAEDGKHLVLRACTLRFYALVWRQ